MILDNRAIFSDKQAIIATANSTNVYDLGQPGITWNKVQLKRRMAKGVKIPLLVQVNADFNNLTSLAIVLQNSDDEAFGTSTELFRIVVLLADLKKGYILPVDQLPRNVKFRYLRFRYEVTGTAPTLGTVTAAFVGAVDGSYQGNI